jgi:hypothetical protein
VEPLVEPPLDVVPEPLVVELVVGVPPPPQAVRTKLARIVPIIPGRTLWLVFTALALRESSWTCAER